MPDGSIENVYTLKIRNMGEHERSYRLSVSGIAGATIVGTSELTLRSGDIVALPVAVQVPREALPAANSALLFGVEARDDAQIRASAESRFLAPVPPR